MQTTLNPGILFHQAPRNVRSVTVRLMVVTLLALVVGLTLDAKRTTAAQGDGNGKVIISGELQQWHKVTLTLDGPLARESDNAPNLFTDFRMTVTFRHESGSPAYAGPGYFAADGDAANSSADACRMGAPSLSLRIHQEAIFARGSPRPFGTPVW